MHRHPANERYGIYMFFGVCFCFRWCFLFYFFLHKIQSSMLQWLCIHVNEQECSFAFVYTSTPCDQNTFTINLLVVVYFFTILILYSKLDALVCFGLCTKICRSMYILVYVYGAVRKNKTKETKKKSQSLATNAQAQGTGTHMVLSCYFNTNQR